MVQSFPQASSNVSVTPNFSFQHIDWSADDKRVLTTTNDADVGYVRIWDAYEMSLYFEVSERGDVYGKGRVVGCDWREDMLAISHYGDYIRIW